MVALNDTRGRRWELSRREFSTLLMAATTAACTGALTACGRRQDKETQPGFKVLADSLRFPEGPVAMNDGSVLIVELERGTLTRVDVDGSVDVIAQVGGGPNGAAIGPDGACYLCNNGGASFVESDGLLLPLGQAEAHSGGRIERVELNSGRVDLLYDSVGGRALSAPNDLVFDGEGGLWFTDLGAERARERDKGGVYYARADGSLINEVVFPLTTPNGIGLSPDGRILYVAELLTARLIAFEITGPGQIDAGSGFLPGRFVAAAMGRSLFDSMAIEADGVVSIATPLAGVINRFSPTGGAVATIRVPGIAPTNICFGGPDMRTAFITLGATGRLIAMDWPRAGLPLSFTA